MTDWAVMEFHNTIKLVLYIESTSKLIDVDWDINIQYCIAVTTQSQ